MLLYVAGCAAGLLAASWTLDLIIALDARQHAAPDRHPDERPRPRGDVHDRLCGRTRRRALPGASGLVAAAGRGSCARRPGRRRRPATWTRTSLVVAQIALSLVLLVGATLLVRTFLTLRPDNPGFTTTDKLTATVRLQGPRAATPAAFFDPLFERLRGIPGVQGRHRHPRTCPSAATSGSRRFAAARNRSTSSAASSWPNYFAEMQIPLVGGRRSTRAMPRARSRSRSSTRSSCAGWVPRAAGVGLSLVVTGIDRKTETRQVVGIVRNTRSNGGDTRVASGAVRAVHPDSVRDHESARADRHAGGPAPAQRDPRSGRRGRRHADRGSHDAAGGPAGRPRRHVALRRVAARARSPAMALLLAAVGLAASIAWGWRSALARSACAWRSAPSPAR